MKLFFGGQAFLNIQVNMEMDLNKMWWYVIFYSSVCSIAFGSICIHSICQSVTKYWQTTKFLSAKQIPQVVMQLKPPRGMSPLLKPVTWQEGFHSSLFPVLICQKRRQRLKKAMKHSNWKVPLQLPPQIPHFLEFQGHRPVYKSGWHDLRNVATKRRPPWNRPPAGPW